MQTLGLTMERTHSYGRWERWALSGIVLSYLLLGTIYSVVTPVFEAPDESYHFFVVKHIVDHRALPVQRAEMRGAWEQEGSQPPLYYLVGALLVSGIDLSDAEALLWRNPQANIGDPLNPGNKNVYVHPPEQDYPWRQSAWAVHVLRFFSLGLGATTVVLAWCIVRLVYPRQGTLARQGVLALSIAGTVAFVPQFLFITASVNNDNAMTCIGTLTLYLLLRRLREGTGEGGATRWIPLGIVLGLALLSKLSALALLVLTGMVIAVVAWYRRSWRLTGQLALAVGLPALAVAGWWYARNLALYGEPTGLTAMWEVVGRREDFGVELWGELRGLRYSFWGLFGWFSIAMPDWVYRALDVLSLIALVGLLLELIRWMQPGIPYARGLWHGAWSAFRYREPEWGAAYRPLSLTLMAVWLGGVTFSLVRWTSLTQGSQGRLLFPAIVPIATFFALGLRAWFLPRARTLPIRMGPDARHAAGVVTVLALLTLSILVPWRWISPHYARPEAIERLPEGAVPLDLAFGQAITLRGARFSQELAYPGEPFPMDLYWEAARELTPSEEVMIWVRLIQESPRSDDPARGVVGLEDSYPGGGTFPVSLWPAGQLLAGRQYVHVGSDAPAPMVARLDVALYEASTGQRLAHPGEDLPTVGRVKVVPRRWPRVQRRQTVARLGPGISLAAYAHGGQARAGETLPVTLTWTVQARPRRDYTVFVHLVDGQGEVWGYGDSAPRQGNYPTWWWDVDEVIVDEHGLVVTPNAPPGQYVVVAGLYGGDGRVPAYGIDARHSDGARLPNDAVALGTVEVR
jgi:4-amino-4-deoxy-L-arabinose transferase-like glycosyltransferase